MSRASQGWPLAKSLSLIPETFRFAMVYGVNPHTGRRTEPWRLRNVIRWVRPNPPVGALGDKFRPATSELMVFCKSKDRFFDLDAVREASVNPIGVGVRPTQARVSGHDINDHRDKLGPFTRDMQMAGAPPLDWWNIPLLDGDEETRYGKKERASGPGSTESGRPRGFKEHHTNTLGDYEANPLGAPPLDWWEITPGGYSGAHYAVFPPELLVKPIKAMCPEKVCRRCGEASRRIVEHERSFAAVSDGAGLSVAALGRGGPMGTTYEVRRDTLGFSDCGHDNYRPGLVLDPFAGSGTTLAVATGHGRDAIGIDLDERNYELSLDRVGPLILQRGEIRDGTGPPD